MVVAQRPLSRYPWHVGYGFKPAHKDVAELLTSNRLLRLPLSPLQRGSKGQPVCYPLLVT